MAEPSIVREQREVMGAIQQVVDDYVQEGLDADARLRMDRESAEQSLRATREGGDGQMRRALELLRECEAVLQPRGIARSLDEIVPLTPPKILEGDLLLGLRICVTQMEVRMLRMQASLGDDSGGGLVKGSIILGALIAVGAILLLPFVGSDSRASSSSWSLGWLAAMLCPFLVAVAIALARATVFRPYSAELDYGYIREQMGYVLYMHQVLMEEARSTFERRVAEREARLAETKEKLAQALRQQLVLLEPRIAQFTRAANSIAPEWTSPTWGTWAPALQRAPATYVGELLAGVNDDRVVVPALVPFPHERALLVKADGAGGGGAGGGGGGAKRAIRAVLLRLVAATPPGELRLVLIDPRGQGQNVSEFLPFADQGFSIGLNNGRAWSEPHQIEQRLQELVTLIDGDAPEAIGPFSTPQPRIGSPAHRASEPVRVLVVLDFPHGFAGTTARLLTDVLRRGPRAGVHPILHVDTSETLPYGFNLPEAENHSTTIAWDGRRFVWQDRDFRASRLELDRMPSGQLATRIVNGALHSVRKANQRVKPRAS